MNAPLWLGGKRYIRGLVRHSGERTDERDMPVLTKEAKQEIFKTHGGDAKNTGSSEGQIALFTARIEHLTAHLKNNKKDHATETSLLDMVGKRKQLLNYLKTYDIERYRAIIAKLGLRK